MVRNTENDGIIFEGPEYTFNEEDFLSCAIPKGTLVLIHGGVVHQSGPNKSDRARNAYTFHVIEGKNVVYDKRNWLQLSEKSFAPIYTSNL
jgi:ectoine hydroxylase-related dioxygenase (phytanoyl-CoA dioxygenase family)